MGTKAIMAYTPEQDRVQDKAGATQDVDQWVGGQLLGRFLPQTSPAEKNTIPTKDQCIGNPRARMMI